MKYHLITLIFFGTLVFHNAQGQKNTDGKYLGLEKMADIEPYAPTHKWYHLTHVTITGDSVRVYQNPIYLLKHDTIWGSSDGGFYYFRGKVAINGNQIVLDLLQTKCDYCAVMVDKNGHILPRHKTMTGQITEKGFMINHHLFRKVEIDDDDSY
jgi:hypothetical protein